MKKLFFLGMVVICAISLVFAGISCKEAATETAKEETTETKEETTEAADTGPIKMGVFSYHTGEYAYFGPAFDGAVEFALEMINENPPLGREIVPVYQETGTIGEAQAARKMIENEKVDILLGVAQEYMSYREWILQYLQDNGRPLMPTIFGGGIDAKYGGTAEETIMRGSPMDVDQGYESVIVAQEAGAETVVILAAEIDSFQFVKDAAIAGCEAVGIEVLDAIDFQVPQNSHRSMVSKAQALDPDAYLIFCPGEDGGTILKNAAELGISSIIVGPSDWLFLEFVETATRSAIDKQKLVRAVAFAPAEGPGWDFYKNAYESDEVLTSLLPADSPYQMQFYDTLNLTMLAIEKAGSLDPGAWVDAMRDVAMSPGTTVYTYKEGFDLLSEGKDIDYYGLNGDMDYTATGVVSGLYGVFGWPDPDDDAYALIDTIDGKTLLELATKANLSTE